MLLKISEISCSQGLSLIQKQQSTCFIHKNLAFIHKVAKSPILWSLPSIGISKAVSVWSLTAHLSWSHIPPDKEDEQKLQGFS